MATAEEFIANLRRIAPSVRRGYTRDGRYVGGTYVWVQNARPYNYSVHVEHCGITLGVNGVEVGMRMGVDMYDSAYTPSGAQAYKNAGRFDYTPRLGSWAFFDWGGAGFGQLWATDHVGCVVDISEWSRGYCNVLEFNTTGNAAGMGYGIVYRRHRSLFTGFGHPRYTTSPPPPPPPPPPTPTPTPDLIVIRNVLAASTVAATT